MLMRCKTTTNQSSKCLFTCTYFEITLIWRLKLLSVQLTLHLKVILASMYWIEYASCEYACNTHPDFIDIIILYLMRTVALLLAMCLPNENLIF